MPDPAAVVKRYFAIVADLGSPAAVRDREAAVAGFLAGKRLLSAQSIELGELLVSGDRVAARATWRGTIAHGSERLPTGSELVAHISGWLTVADRRIREHETYDCYEPLPSDREGETP